jgi:hypothetical protein
LNDFLLKIQILQFYITDSTLVYTAIGPIDVYYKRLFVNFFAKIAIPVINAQIASGIHIPQQFFGFI